MPLLDHFPGEPREMQKEALQKIEKALASNKKYIILSAPTGSGKSHIAATVALHSKPAPQGFINMVNSRQLFSKDDFGRFIHEKEAYGYGNHRTMVCTVTKSLQDQYDNLFTDKTSLFKGKTNYPCNEDPNFDCEIAPCLSDPKLKETCLHNKLCPYFNARDNTLVSTFSVLNYSAFLNLPSHTKQVEFLICDEASELEDELVGHCSVEIVYDPLNFAMPHLHLDKLRSENPAEGLIWLTNLGEDLKMEYDKMAHRLSKMRGHIKPKQLAIEMKNFKYVKTLYDKIVVLLNNWYKSEMIVELGKDRVLFVPLHVNNLAHLLFDNAHKVILMSAVIIEPPTFAKQLGIKDYEYIELPSTFEAAKSPIYCNAAKYNLSYNKIDANLPKVIEQVGKICDHYANDKGIIHTHNFKITEKIQNAFKKNKRFIFREPGINNERLLKMHRDTSVPSVVVSPSLAFGTDLPDDLGRFQVIVKLPFLPLGSKRVKTLFDKDKVWYQNKMLCALVQAAGRCTRHREDYADTFILDGQILQVLKSNWNKLPTHFRERIH